MGTTLPTIAVGLQGKYKHGIDDALSYFRGSWLVKIGFVNDGQGAEILSPVELVSVREYFEL